MPVKVDQVRKGLLRHAEPRVDFRQRGIASRVQRTSSLQQLQRGDRPCSVGTRRLLVHLQVAGCKNVGRGPGRRVDFFEPTAGFDRQFEVLCLLVYPGHQAQGGGVILVPGKNLFRVFLRLLRLSGEVQGRGVFDHHGRIIGLILDFLCGILNRRRPVGIEAPLLHDLLRPGLEILVEFLFGGPQHFAEDLLLVPSLCETVEHLLDFPKAL